MVWSRMMMRFWNSASVAVHAALRRISQYDDATRVFHVRVLHIQLLRPVELASRFCPGVDLFQEGRNISG